VKLNPQQERNILEEFAETNQKDVVETWLCDEIHYSDYKKFEKIFDVYEDSHFGIGNEFVCHKSNMQWPEEIDPDRILPAFIKETLENQLPITVTDFQKAWGVLYKPGNYSGLHAHLPSIKKSRQLTAVLFLNELKKDSTYKKAGDLVTLVPLENYEMGLRSYTPKAGDMVIMDGRVYHGVYPTIHERKVFVCDFSYEAN